MILLRLSILAACFIVVGTVEARASAPTSERIAVRLAPDATIHQWSRSTFAASQAVQAGVTVDGHDLTMLGIGSAVDFAGRGVIVRLVSAHGKGPIYVRMASVRNRAVRVVVLLRWGK